MRHACRVTACLRRHAYSISRVEAEQLHILLVLAGLSSTSLPPPVPISDNRSFMSINAGLTDAELEQLADFLSSSGAAMTMEELDGYFAALICSPRYISMNEYFPKILGEHFAFASDDQAMFITGLLFQHWNAITDQLQNSIEQSDVIYLPLLYQNEDGLVYGNKWASGFMQGTQMCPWDWSALLDDKSYGGSLIPIMMLANEHHADAEMRPPPIPREKREDILAMMTAGVIQIFRYFEPHRQSFAERMAMEGATPFRRTGPKIGRNDPCPCESGKKYKTCCGKTRTLH